MSPPPGRVKMPRRRLRWSTGAWPSRGRADGRRLADDEEGSLAEIHGEERSGGQLNYYYYRTAFAERRQGTAWRISPRLRFGSWRRFPDRAKAARTFLQGAYSLSSGFGLHSEPRTLWTPPLVF
jgi:hypothetical protein